MQRLQIRALKITFSKDGNLESSALHQKARIMELDQRADMQLLCLTYRRTFNIDKYPQLVTEGDFITRSTAKIKFDLPRPTSEKFKAFPLYRGVKLWDSLPSSIQRLESYNEYKSKLKRFLWEKAYPP